MFYVSYQDKYFGETVLGWTSRVIHFIYHLNTLESWDRFVQVAAVSWMQLAVDVTAIRGFHNFQRVMDFFQPIFLPCSYLLEDSKWILFTVITVLTAARLQCIRLMLTRYPADAGNVYSLFKLFPHPLCCCLNSIFWAQRTEGAKPSNTGDFLLSVILL